MKKIKTILLILFALIIGILVFFLVKNLNHDKNTNNDEKIIAEIKYMDNKLTYLLNSLNGISLENNTKISSNNQELDWDNIKSEVEQLYATIPTMTLDLYNMNANQEDILNFNKEFDKLIVDVKNENKNEALVKLANLYRYLPAYTSNVSNDNELIGLMETKSNVFNGYVYTCIDNWEEANNHIKRAIESYSKVLNNIGDTKNNHKSNKIYVILNELNSATEIRNIEVFFIKYKNFLEEAESVKFK